LSGPVLIDTGPLVAFLLKRERNHAWAAQQFAETSQPFFTCEAVISEAAFLLSRTRVENDLLLELLERSIVKIVFELSEHLREVRQLMRRYRDVPMSLADACLVRMSEVQARSSVLTLDRHFTVYRRQGRHVIPTLMPG